MQGRQRLEHLEQSSKPRLALRSYRQLVGLSEVWQDLLRLLAIYRFEFGRPSIAESCRLRACILLTASVPDAQSCKVRKGTVRRVMSASVCDAPPPRSADRASHLDMGRGVAMKPPSFPLHVYFHAAPHSLLAPCRFYGCGASAYGDSGGQYSKQWLGAQWPARGFPPFTPRESKPPRATRRAPRKLGRCQRGTLTMCCRADDGQE